MRVQLALRDAVQKAIADFTGIGGAGVVIDINTGEVMAMVSLPDYDATDPAPAPAGDDRPAPPGRATSPRAATPDQDASTARRSACTSRARPSSC